MAYQRKKKQPQRKATPSPKKTDEKLKPKTKENKQMRIFFLIFISLTNIKNPHWFVCWLM